MSDDSPLTIHREPWDPERSRRSRLRWFLGAGAVSLLALFSSCVGCMVVGYRASAQGAVFAADSMVSIGKTWNADALIDAAAPEFLTLIPPTKARTFIAFLADRLGPLMRCGEVESAGWKVSFGPGGPAVYSRHYSDCQFERGPGRITLLLVRRAGTWKIVSINFNSDLLIEPDKRVSGLAPGAIVRMLAGRGWT